MTSQTTLLYDPGKGADIVIAVNPEYTSGDKKIRKISVAAHRSSGVSFEMILPALQKKEPGWGGPDHMTFIGSPTDRDSEIQAQYLVSLICESY